MKPVYSEKDIRRLVKEYKDFLRAIETNSPYKHGFSYDNHDDTDTHFRSIKLYVRAIEKGE